MLLIQSGDETMSFTYHESLQLSNLPIKFMKSKCKVKMRLTYYIKPCKLWSYQTCQKEYIKNPKCN